MNYTQVQLDIMKKLELNKNDEFIDKGIEFLFNTLSINIRRILVIGIILIIIPLLIPTRVLLATDFDTGDYIKAWKVSEGDSFIIQYTHSVQLTDVSEKYLVSGRDIILIEAEFSSFGAGLPATTPYKFSLEEGGFRIYDINQKMENLIYRTGAVRANHRLILEDRQYMFLDFTEPRDGIKFTIDRMPFIFFAIREGFN